MLRANLHPCYHLNSESSLCTLPVREFSSSAFIQSSPGCFCVRLSDPIPLPCNAGKTLEPTEQILPHDLLRLFSAGQSFSLYVLPFSPLLKGNFQDLVTEIFTTHLLSLLPKTKYSSLSLHFLLKI